MCVGYFDSRQNHIYPFDGKLRATLLLVFKPLAERLDLFLRVGREQMFDGHVRWRDENRFRVRESVEAGLAVVVADARESDAAERHGFDEQMYVHLLIAPPPKDKLARKWSVAFWSRLKRKAESGFGCFFTSRMAASISL